MSDTQLLEKPQVTTLSDKAIVKMAVSRGVEPSKLRSLDDYLRMLIIRMDKTNKMEDLQPIRAEVFDKVGQKYAVIGSKVQTKLKNALEFLCITEKIDVTQLTHEERQGYLTRAQKGREIVASTPINELRPSEFLTRNRIDAIKDNERSRIRKKAEKSQARLAKWQANKLAEKNAVAEKAKLKPQSKRALRTAFEMWQKEIQEEELRKKVALLEEPKVTLDTGFEKPMPFSLERSLKRQARKSKRFETRRKYEKHVSKRDRFFEDVEVDFDLVRPDPLAAGLCPHPEKKVYVTRNQARRFIKAYHPFDKDIHPYVCECGALHIGH